MNLCAKVDEPTFSEKASSAMDKLEAKASRGFAKFKNLFKSSTDSGQNSTASADGNNPA